jgi:hypothetical protein
VKKTIIYSVMIRLFISAVISLIFIVSGPEDYRVSFYFRSFITIYVFWEFHYRILRYCYDKVVVQSVIFQTMFLAGWSIIIFSFIFFLTRIFVIVEVDKKSIFLLFLVMTVVTVFHILLMTLRQLSYQKVEQFKETSLLLEERYKSIKSKTILHFLQNSLEATQKLITINPEKANQQIEALTTMIRSLLQSRDKDYISLKEESDLVQEFVKLLELQGNVKILFSIEEEPAHHNYQIPPFVLILIFDNIFLNRSFIPFAELQVYVENGIYLVAKYRQLAKSSFLEKQEELLKNLKERYSFTKQDTNVVMIVTQTHTYIKVPLLKPM